MAKKIMINKNTEWALGLLKREFPQLVQKAISGKMTPAQVAAEIQKNHESGSHYFASLVLSGKRKVDPAIVEYTSVRNRIMFSGRSKGERYSKEI